jgi:RNA polymerase sigma factor for flagellar operon FliA
MDWVPRLVRSRAYKLDTASKQLEVELGRSPTNDELAARLKVTPVEFERMTRDADAVGLVSLSTILAEDDKHTTIEGFLEAPKTVDAYEPDQSDQLTSILRGTSRRQRTIVQLYTIDGLTMKEIGHSIGISESMVSKTFGEVIRMLKAKLLRDPVYAKRKSIPFHRKQSGYRRQGAAA